MLMEQFFQENVPLRHMINEEALIMSWGRSIIKEVNDWDLNRNIFHFHTNRSDKMPSVQVPKNISDIQIHTKKE